VSFISGCKNYFLKTPASVIAPYTSDEVATSQAKGGVKGEL